MFPNTKFERILVFLNDIEAQNNKGEIVMYQPDETIRLEVRMGEETIRLYQNAGNASIRHPKHNKVIILTSRNSAS